jgi:hypothetical protein
MFIRNDNKLIAVYSKPHPTETHIQLGQYPTWPITFTVSTRIRLPVSARY